MRGSWVRLVALVMGVMLLGLGGCRHYERVVEDAHDRYEAALRLRTEGPIVAETADQLLPETGRAARPRRTKGQRSAHSSGFRLFPKTPYVGSPEYRAEAEQEARREREIKRRMSGICSGC